MQIPLLGTYRYTELLGRSQGGGVSSLTISCPVATTM